MVVKRDDYPEPMVEAARSVMLELVRLLGEYREDVVVIGGWVPELLMPDARPAHVGSTDVDLALNHLRLQESGYETIRNLLAQHGYRQGAQPFIFLRDVAVGDTTITIQVDLLAGEYQGTGRGRRHQDVQDIKARKARGADPAFGLYREIPLEGKLPGGARDRAIIRVASIVPFFVMKGMALAERLKEKDAWDLYYCLLHYPGGSEAIAAEFAPHLGQGLVKEGLAHITEKFASPDHLGPTYVADFEAVRDPEDRERIQRDAYERMHHLLDLIGPTGA